MKTSKASRSVLSQLLNAIGFVVAILSLLGAFAIVFATEFPQAVRWQLGLSAGVYGVTIGLLLMAAARALDLLGEIAAQNSSPAGDFSTLRNLEHHLGTIAYHAQTNTELQRQLLEAYGHAPRV